jgi:hypothetical protein
MDDPQIKLWPGALPVAWYSPLHGSWHFRIPLWFGQINIKPTVDEPFSQRYNHSKTLRFAGWSAYWRRYVRFGQ